MFSRQRYSPLAPSRGFCVCIREGEHTFCPKKTKESPCLINLLSDIEEASKDEQ